jgi:diguanylate cyclase (GGDEF)-like protein
LTSWGETRLIAWRNIEVPTDNLDTIEYACIGEDITERRRREIALQRQAMQEQIVVDITRKLRETLDLTTILETAANSIKSGLMAERVVIFQFETPGSGSIVADTDVVPVVPQYRSPQVTAWLDRSRIPQSLEMLDIPILQYSPAASASLWGLLIVYLNISNHEIFPRNEAFLRPLADQLAIAIYQSEQYAQVEKELLERQKIAVKFQHDALHDPLTGLHNRLALDEALNNLISTQEFAFAILFLDLDRFKSVNDIYGHSAGDQLLQLVAQRLQACIREGDMAIRLGGDEFVLLVRSVVHISEAIEVAQRVHQSLSEPISFGFGNIEVRTSIGIAVGDRRLPINRLLADADHAMYRAKRYHLDYAIAGIEDELTAGS